MRSTHDLLIMIKLIKYRYVVLLELLPFFQAFTDLMCQRTFFYFDRNETYISIFSCNLISIFFFCYLERRRKNHIHKYLC